MGNMGLDLNKRESQLCILTAEGEAVELRIRTSRERFTEVRGGRAPATGEVHAVGIDAKLTERFIERGHRDLRRQPDPQTVRWCLGEDCDGGIAR